MSISLLTVKCQVSFFSGRLTFFLAFLSKVDNGEGFVFLAFLANVINGESFSCSWYIWPRVPTVDVLTFRSLIGQGYRRWKLLFFLAFLAKVQRKFWSFWLRLLLLVTLAMNINGESYVIWSLLLSNLRHPALPNASLCSLEAMFGTPLCKQQLTLREATVGMVLEVRMYSCTGRQAMAWKYEYIRTTVGKTLIF